MKAFSKTLLSASVAFFAALSMVGCQANEPVSSSDPGNVAGRVRTVSGEPAVDAKVYAFRDSSGTPVDSAKTDADGKYFLDLAKGEYDLYIDRKGSEGGRISRVGATATRRDLGETRLVPVIVTSVDLGLPQERIDSIRISGSVLPGKIGADGKLGVPSLQGETVVVKVSMKDEAGKAVSGTLNLRAVGGTVVVDWVADSSNALPVVGGAEGTHFGADTSTVALWSFDTIRGGVVYDRTRNGRNLSLIPGGSWGRSGDSVLTPAPTGKILYEARVKLSKYPSSSLHNGRAVVVGFYEGLKLVVTDHGQLQAGAQRGDGTWNWFAPETKDSLVPLGKWVDLAVGADQATGDVYVWIDGKALPTWSGVKVSGGKIRVATSTFVVGQDAVDGQKFDGLISEVRVSRRFVRGAGIASGVDACIDHLKPCKVPVVKIDTPVVKIDTPKVVVPRKIDSLVAHWNADSSNASTLVDRTGNGFDLKKLATGVWSRASDTNLTPKVTGRILYQAKVKLSKYPSSSLHNGRAVVVGFYEGLKLVVTDHGQLQAGAQRGDGTWNWFAPETKDSLVPLGKWVDLAVGADQATGDVYVWIDGKALPTWSGVKVLGTRIRVAASTFVLGQDAVDGQKFDGQIGEVKVWNRFVLGVGIASGVDSCIDHLKPCKVPVVRIDTPVVKIDTPVVKIDTPKVVVPRKTDSLVAHWNADSSNASTLVDRTGNGFDLKKLATGVWSRASDTNLTPKVTGRILYQAKVKLSKYPSSSLHNGRAVVVGFYEGLKLVVTDHGQLQAGAQRGDGTWNWFAPETKDSLVPLGKWVELAVGADQATGDVYVWIDGKALPTWSGVKVSGTRIRVAASTFVLGQDAVDGQKFDGQIGEVKVWNRFVLGAGIASGVDPSIDL